MTMKRLIRRELANVNDKFIALKDFLKNYFLGKYVKMSLLLDAADSDDSE